MNKIVEYKSVLAPFIMEFIMLKESSGINVRENRLILLEIDTFFIANHIADPAITRSVVEQWRRTRVNDSSNTLHNKYSVWSQLSRFMNRHGCECYVPQLPRYTRSTRPGYAPYIFTHEQIAGILNKSEELITVKNLSYAVFCIPAMLRLLYSTGLRISEALSIKNSDVKMNKGYILIRKTKNGCERIVPINDDLKNILQQYIYYRNRMPLKNTGAPDNPFFIKPDGNQCTHQGVYKWFRKLLRACGIPYTGNNQGPRIHDLRHTMAVHALEKMVRDGMDLYAAMPIISTCLGHKSLEATGQYVRLTYEMYPDLSEKSSAITAFVYPNI